MPTLTYADDDGTTLKAGRLTGRALVGRRLSHGVVLADPGVSRLHAWVDRGPDGGWVVTDAGSKTGTAVNDKPVYRHDLRDGDVIRFGATRVTYRAADELPPGATPVELSPPPGGHVLTSGILFTCGNCSAPIWVGHDLAGKRGRCRHCKQQIVAPVAPADVEARPAPAVVPPPTGPSAARRPQCGVCHAAIAEAESRTTCGECDTTFHAECWDENYGCSTYGCGQVNALNPAAKAAAATAAYLAAQDSTDDPPSPGEDPTDDGDDATADAPPARMPWEWVTLLGAFVASVVGVMTFGVPPLIVAVIAAVLLVRRRPDTRAGLLAAALVLAVVGAAAGVVLSDFLILGGRHLHGLHH